MKKRIILVALAAVVAAGGYMVWKRVGPGAAALQEGAIVAYGNTEVREVNLAFRVGGRIARMTVDEGDPVEPGMELARLDAEPYERQLAAAQARRAGAAAELGRLRNGFRAEEIAQASAQVERSRALARRTEGDLERQRQLGTAAGTRQDLERAVAAHGEAVAQLAAAEAALALMQAGYRAEEIAAGEARLAEADAEIERLRLQIADCVLTAPSEGVVLTRVLEPGAMAAAGQTVFAVSLQDRAWVRAYIPQKRLGDIHPGMPAEVYTDARRDRPYTGKVGFISPRAEFTPKNVETEELRSDLVFRFRVVIDEPDEGLRQGMPVTVHLKPAE